ncbi:hypothetical protein CR513_47660, partial [Mucuna pruriens]
MAETTKIPFPTFDGNVYRFWRAKCEQYFILEEVPERQKAKLILMTMTGKAFAWMRHYMSHKGKENLQWKQIMYGAGCKFDDGNYEDPLSELPRLKQSGSSGTSLEEFDELLARAGVDDSIALSIFLGGLRIPLEKAVSKGTHPAYGPMIKGAEGNKENSKGRKIRKLPEAEYQEKMKKGLCFTCDEKFSPEHVCKNNHYQAMILEEMIETQGDMEEETVVQLALQSMAGLTPKRALKLWGTLGNRQVTVLIDSGATHNFISQKIW